MAKIGFLFPGQGAQYVGMGQELARQYPSVARRFQQLNELVGFDLTRLCWEGPEQELKKTANQQPAILALSVACMELLAAEGIRPDVAAGLSLGEYGALVAAGVLSFEEAVPLVRARGTYMQEAVPLGVGCMAAILGLSTGQVDDLCARAARETGLHVEGANYNCPGQVVVSGHTEAVERCMALAVQAGGRAVRLSVTAPFHSRLLAPAGERLAEALAAVPLWPAQIPVVANVTADYVTDPAEIRRLLIEQVSRPVRWEESVRRMIADGVDTFVEVGPSRTLTGFLRKIDKGVRALQVEDPASLGRVLDSLGRVC